MHACTGLYLLESSHLLNNLVKVACTNFADLVIPAACKLLESRQEWQNQLGAAEFTDDLHTCCL